jgi:hypothetical protein
VLITRRGCSDIGQRVPSEVAGNATDGVAVAIP